VVESPTIIIKKERWAGDAIMTQRAGSTGAGEQCKAKEGHDDNAKDDPGFSSRPALAQTETFNPVL
jgi:hypothetical protein